MKQAATATGGIPAAAVPYAACALGLAALVLGYAVALHHGDIPSGITNLPDITHCVLTLPARGIFLGLFMPAISLMAVSWIAGPAVNAATSAVPKTTYVGLVACALLLMGEAVLDQHPMWTVRLSPARLPEFVHRPPPAAFSHYDRST